MYLGLCKKQDTAGNKSVKMTVSAGYPAVSAEKILRVRINYT